MESADAPLHLIVIHMDAYTCPQVNSRLETLRHHMTEIQRQKQTVHEYLYSNNESIGRIQAEINTSCNNSSGRCAGVLHEYVPLLGLSSLASFPGARYGAPGIKA